MLLVLANLIASIMSAYYAWYYRERLIGVSCSISSKDTYRSYYRFSEHFGLEEALSAIYSSYAVSVGYYEAMLDGLSPKY